MTGLRHRRWFVAVLLLFAATAGAAWAPRLAEGPADSLFLAFATVAAASFLALALRGWRAGPEADRRRATRAVWIVALALRLAVYFAPPWLADAPDRDDVAARLVICAADLALLALLLNRLKQADLPPARAILYAWHPLVVLEFAAAGRADAFALVLLVAALTIHDRAERGGPGGGARASWASGAFTGIAGAIAPQGLAPIFDFLARRRWHALAATGATLLLMLGFPFHWRGESPLEPNWPFELARRATAEPPFNGLVHPSLARLAESLAHLFGRGADPRFEENLGRVLSLLFFLALAVALVRHFRGRPKALALGILVAWIATAPTVLPRDVVWLAPFLPFLGPRRARALLLLTVTILVAEVVRAPGTTIAAWSEPPWIALLTWIAPCTLAALDLWRAGAGPPPASATPP